MLQGFMCTVCGCLTSSLCRIGLVSVGKVWHCYNCLSKLAVARRSSAERKGFAFFFVFLKEAVLPVALLKW